MSLGPEIRELLDSVALGTATLAEIREAEEMAEVNPVIARELFELRQAAGLLATNVPVHKPPASLRRAVMDEVRADVAASFQAAVVATLTWVGARDRAPSAIARAVPSLTAPSTMSRLSDTPSISVLASSASRAPRATAWG